VDERRIFLRGASKIGRTVVLPAPKPVHFLAVAWVGNSFDPKSFRMLSQSSYCRGRQK
jgi:hypothetical protein